MGAARVALLLLCSFAGVLVVDSTVNYRTVTFVNQCNQPVRVGRTGAQCLSRDDTTYPLTGCPTQMTLNPSTNQCHWDIPNFGNGTNLQPGENVSKTFSGLQFQCTGEANAHGWSGNFWAATGCDGASCETGLCYFGPNDPRNGYCVTYQGPVGPLTRAEFTFQDSFDVYDVSSVDGVNIPVEIRPLNPAPPAVSGALADYWCGNPGGMNATNGNLSGCSWMYDFRELTEYGDQSVSLTLVAQGTTNEMCSRDSDCTTTGEVCGVLQQLDSPGGPGSQLFRGRCGRLIGIWTSDSICAWTSGFSTPNAFPNNQPFRCMTSTGQGSGTFSDLYRCAAPQYDTSGYTDPSPSSCDPMTTCGCRDWLELGIIAPATSSCQCNNTVWLDNALPWLEPIKKACPTSYTYPFDDVSSTFQCNSAAGINNVDYTVTFCPGGPGIARAMQTAGGSMVVYQSGLLVTICALVIAFLR